MIRRRRTTNLLIITMLCVLFFTPTTVQADTHDPASGKQLNYVAHCVNAVNDISKNGFGATRSSCMGWDPALPTCYFNCQPLVKRLYEWCDNVCLPDGFYFDPSTCWIHTALISPCPFISCHFKSHSRLTWLTLLPLRSPTWQKKQWKAAGAIMRKEWKSAWSDVDAILHVRLVTRSGITSAWCWYRLSR